MSNQDYTQSGQSMDEDMDQGMGQDQYGQSQGSGMGDNRGASDREYGMSDHYAQSGTLNQGYGQGQQMGEDQWSQQGSQMNPDQPDPMRGNIGASASDRFQREMSERAGGGGDTGEEFRDMTGGMYGGGDDNQRGQ